MTTVTQAAELVSVPLLAHGDVIHIGPHEVFRHTVDVHLVQCRDADVLVDCEIPVGTVVVICWRACDCPSVFGAVVYDADDTVMRSAVAA